MEKNEIFKTNPNLKEVHMTSDGHEFYNDGDARNHAKSLDDKKVELILNPDHIEIVDEEVENPEVETPEVENPEVETPEIETPEVEAKEVEAPAVETPVGETKKSKAAKK